MSLCTRSVMQTSRHSRLSKVTFLYLKRQLATETQSTSSQLSTSSSPPPVSPNPTPNAIPPPTKGRRKPKSKYLDGTLHTLETMPYTAYQAALKYLREDRLEKFQQVKEERDKIKAWMKHKGVTEDDPRIKSMQRYIDE